MTSHSEGPLNLVEVHGSTTELSEADAMIRSSTDLERGTDQEDRSTSTSSPPSTLAEALTFVKQRNLMPPRALDEARSAVNLLWKVVGRDADHLPAVPKDLTPLIESAFPARLRIRPKRWLNAISSIRALLRACGLHAPLARSRLPLHPEWVALLLTIKEKRERLRILGFACWCSERGIPPSAVTEQILADYKMFRQNWTIRTGLTQLISAIRIYWNRGVRANRPGWPARLLIAPRHPHIEALPLNCFPISFQNELNQFLTGRSHPDAFDPTEGLWRPATVRVVRRLLIRAASLVAGRVGGPDNIRSLAQIVTVESVEFILRHLYDRAGGEWRESARNFATYLFWLARDFVRVDATALARIDELRGIIVKRTRERRKPGLSEWAAERVMPFDDPKLRRRLFQLPGELYRRAGELRRERPVRAAQLHEQALMLDILEHDPMRCHNLATINFKTDFKRDERRRIHRLWISADRTKNGIAIDTPIPIELAKHIETHLTVHRPHLPGADSPWLFPSPKGTPRTADNVSKAVGRVVTASLGVRFSPHLMRHITATVLYRANPNNGVVVQRVLRHTNIKTTERAYGVMSNAGSSAAWQEELRRFRQTDRGRGTRSRIRRAGNADV